MFFTIGFDLLALIALLPRLLLFLLTSLPLVFDDRRLVVVFDDDSLLFESSIDTDE